jgi:hypothetical protein
MNEPRIAVAICLHHKPWLAMASLVSLLTQSRQDYDLFFLFNEGDGSCPNKPGYADYRALATIPDASPLIAQSPAIEKHSYAAYDRLARESGINPKLSPFDERLREVCRISRPNTFDMSFENDQALDSGVWLKFIRSQAWRPYDYVFAFQEGTLLTSHHSLSAAVDMARSQNLEFLASAHMKGRLPKSFYSGLGTSGFRLENPTPVDLFHDAMGRRVIDILCRDPELRAAFDSWAGDEAPSRQYHVRDYDIQLLHRAINFLAKDRKITGGRSLRRLKILAQTLLPSLARFDLEYLLSSIFVLLHDHLGARAGFRRDFARERVFSDATLHPLLGLIRPVASGDVLFHRVDEPGWHAAGCNHMFSRGLLEEIDRQFDRYGMYEVLDVPFAGSFLEIFWAYVPFWRGRDMWFWDGFHRVTKDPWTLTREDTPQGMALHLNRYSRGLLTACPAGDYLVLRRLSKDVDYIRSILPPFYFSQGPK